MAVFGATLNLSNEENLSPPIHIVLVRFSSLGDVILTTSLIKFLRNWGGKNLYLTYLTSRPFVPLLQGHPHIDQVVGIEREHKVKKLRTEKQKAPQGGLRGLYQLVKKIDEERPITLFIDAHGTLRSLFLRSVFFFKPWLVVDKRTFERWLLTGPLKLNFLSGEHLLRRIVKDFAGIFGVNDVNAIDQILKELEGQNGQLSTSFVDTLNWQQEIFPTLRPELAKLLSGDHFWIGLVPSASYVEKRWPIKHFQELLELFLEDENLKKLKAKVMILAGPEDTFCSQFNGVVEKSDSRIVNLQGQTNLDESMRLVKMCSVVLGNDTGLPHMAESVGTPVLVILGPTGEEFGFHPHLKNSRPISLKLWCRPCTTNGAGFCIRSERFCLTKISPARVLAELKEVSHLIDEESKSMGVGAR